MLRASWGEPQDELEDTAMVSRFLGKTGSFLPPPSHKFHSKASWSLATKKHGGEGSQDLDYIWEPGSPKLSQEPKEHSEGV